MFLESDDALLVFLIDDRYNSSPNLFCSFFGIVDAVWSSCDVVRREWNDVAFSMVRKKSLVDGPERLLFRRWQVWGYRNSHRVDHRRRLDRSGSKGAYILAD